MSRADYEGPMAAAYDRGRTLHPEAMAVWRSAIELFIGHPDGTILDLGSGTGRFSAALAAWFDVPVVGVEPAWGMLEAALRKEPHPRVAYVRGAAEHLPLSNDSCRLAWLSNSAHHFDDMGAAAGELRRVLPDGAPVLIRCGGFADRAPEITLFRYFPEAARVLDDFPSFAETVATFGREGWHLERVDRFSQVFSRSLREYLERAQTRADSTLEAISDDAFEAGLARIAADAAREETPTPIRDQLELLLLR